jgi:hypothetical protein
MKLHTKPWKHIIIDDFLEENHFNKLNDIAKDIVMEPGIVYNIYRSYLSSNGTLLDYNKTLKIYENLEMPNMAKFKFFNLANYLDIDTIKEMYNCYSDQCIDALKFLNSGTMPDRKYIFIFDLQATQSDYVVKTHLDSISKLLTLVTYLHPEDNIGTTLFEPDKITATAVTEWKQNRAFIFKRGEDTWHTFGSTSQRTTFNINVYLSKNQ